MNFITYTLFASIQEDAHSYNTAFVALDIDYISKEVRVVAKNENEAILAFQKSNEYIEFANKHINTNVYTYIKTKEDKMFRRV